MLLMMPADHAAAGARFRHADLRAARHPITAGFISPMILGMAAKVLPTVNGHDPRSLSALWGPFVRVNPGLGRIGRSTQASHHPQGMGSGRSGFGASPRNQPALDHRQSEARSTRPRRTGFRWRSSRASARVRGSTMFRS
jgi:hypothetical protein